MLCLQGISGRSLKYPDLHPYFQIICVVLFNCLVTKKGASSWLSVLSIGEHGFKIKVLFRMHCVCDMVGYLEVFLLSVFVAMALLLIMQ